jgi:hypothetical protein
MQKIKIRGRANLPVSARDIEDKVSSHLINLNKSLAAQIVKHNNVFKYNAKSFSRVLGYPYTDIAFTDKLKNSVISLLHTEFPYIKEDLKPVGSKIQLNFSGTGSRSLHSLQIKFNISTPIKSDPKSKSETIKQYPILKLLYRYLHSIQRKILNEKLPVSICLNIDSVIPAKVEETILNKESLPENISVNYDKLSRFDITIIFTPIGRIGIKSRINNADWGKRSDKNSILEFSHAFPNSISYQSFLSLEDYLVTPPELAKEIKSYLAEKKSLQDTEAHFKHILTPPIKTLFFADDFCKIMKSLLRINSYENIETFFLPRKN